MDPAGYAYPVDGLIVEYDDLAFGRALGATGHHENRLMALKWQDKVIPARPPILSACWRKCLKTPSALSWNASAQKN